jgi:uncharacterized protein YuzE
LKSCCSGRWQKRVETLKIEYDTDHDLLNIEFLADVPIDDSLETDGVVIDYAEDKRIVAIEVLDASKRTTHNPADLIGLAVVHGKPAPSDRVREREAGYGKKKKKR